MDARSIDDTTVGRASTLALQKRGGPLQERPGAAAAYKALAHQRPALVSTGRGLPTHPRFHIPVIVLYIQSTNLLLLVT